MHTESYRKNGTVYLVGAGPGDPDLITVKGSRILKEADVIVYDRLSNPDLLSITSERSEHIYVGKRPGQPSVSQEQINHILVTKAREGKTVTRLKGGDPFVFGRGGEECEALKAAGIQYEIVPGIGSALAAPAFAGIPVTHRGMGRSFTVVTGHTVSNSGTFQNWGHIAHADTLVVLMGMRNLSKIADILIGHGRPGNTPVAVIEKATYKSQRFVTGTLSDIAHKAKDLSPPATIVIGELASLSNDLSWYQSEESATANEESFNSPMIASFTG